MLDSHGKVVSTDGATVHGQPLANVVLSCVTHRKPLGLGIDNCSAHLLTDGNKGGLFYAENVAAKVRALPDKGHSVVMVCTDTPSDMQRAASINSIDLKFS
jgi:hypothetical protein